MKILFTLIMVTLFSSSIYANCDGANALDKRGLRKAECYEDIDHRTNPKNLYYKCKDGTELALTDDVSMRMIKECLGLGKVFEKKPMFIFTCRNKSGLILKQYASSRTEACSDWED